MAQQVRFRLALLFAVRAETGSHVAGVDVVGEDECHVEGGGLRKAVRRRKRRRAQQRDHFSSR